MCYQASKQIQIKSHHIEDAVFEIIDLLYQEEIDTKLDDDSQTSHSSTDLQRDNSRWQGMYLNFTFCLVCE